MAGSKKKRPSVAETARPKTEYVRVEGAYGGIDRVHRVVDTLSGMLKRRQIGQREYKAADRLRDAFETLTATMGGTMDFDRVRGGSMPGGTPAPAQIIAAETVDTAKRITYRDDFEVIRRVCGFGMTIEQAAESLFGAPTTRAERDKCSIRLSAGLKALADYWLPDEEREKPVRGSIMEKARAFSEGTIEPGGVVHATRDKVFGSGQR